MPLAALIVFTLARTGFGRLLYAVGDNERATHLSGVQYWQVITTLYVTSSVLVGITGLLYIDLIKAPPLSLAEPLVLPSVAVAVIGGTSIFGDRGGYTHHRRPDPDRADDAADAGGRKADSVRADRAFRDGGLFADCRGAVIPEGSRWRPMEITNKAHKTATSASNS